MKILSLLMFFGLNSFASECSDALSFTHTWPKPAKEPGSQFLIGGKNSNAAIKALKTLSGIAISKLEGTLRPNQSSMAGFLGQKESLIDVLIADNTYVTEELGVSHQQLADPMRFVRDEWNQKRGDLTLELAGRRYKVTGQATRGMQPSPFEDKTGTNLDITVVNLDNNSKIKFSGLLPDMIWRYGFYEGVQTPYRVDPRAIVEVFDFIQPTTR